MFRPGVASATRINPSLASWQSCALTLSLIDYLKARLSRRTNLKGAMGPVTPRPAVPVRKRRDSCLLTPWQNSRRLVFTQTAARFESTLIHTTHDYFSFYWIDKYPSISRSRELPPVHSRAYLLLAGVLRKHRLITDEATCKSAETSRMT